MSLMPCGDHKVATTSTRWRQKLCHGEWSCVVSGFIGANMQTRFSRRLAIVRERIEELEQIAPETLVVPNETEKS